MATAGRARITLAAEDKTGPAFASAGRNLGGLQGSIASIGASFAGLSAGIAGLAVGLAANSFKGIVDGLDKLNDLADATGSSIGNLSALEDVALRTGTSFETVAATLLKFNQALNSSDDPKIAAVLKEIGLNAADLKKLDPAEALLRTAEAFQGFAEDGSRARAEQVLFGRSLKDIAPFVKDLAEAGALNAKVTEEQTAAAERFNKHLFAIEAASLQAKRGIVNELLPALDAIAVALAGAGNEAKAFNLVGEALRVVVETFAVTGAYVVDIFAGVGREIGAFYAQVHALATLNVEGFNAISQAVREDNERAKTELAKFVANVMRTNAAVREAGGGRGFVNPAGIAAPSLGNVTGKASPGKAVVSEYDKYIERLGEALHGTQELTEAEKFRMAYSAGKLGELTEAQRLYGIELANVLDLAKKPAAMVGPEIPPALLDLRKKAAADLAGLVGDSDAAKYEALALQAQNLAAGFADGSISAQDFGRGAEVLGKRFDELGPKLEKVTTFAEQAQRNIQDALGETVLRTLEGNFSSIEKLWGDMLKRMVAQAIAAQLNSYLFGDGKGSNTGAIGSLFAGWFGGARANGGPVQAGRAYLVGESGPEIVVPNNSGTVIPNGAMGTRQAGASASYHIIVQGDATPATARMIENALAKYDQQRRRMG